MTSLMLFSLLFATAGAAALDTSRAQLLRPSAIQSTSLRSSSSTRLCDAASNKEEPRVEILSAGVKGQGVFAAERINRGRWICLYEGTLVRAAPEEEEAPPFDPLGLLTTSSDHSSSEDDSIPELDKSSSYLLELAPNLFIDAQNSTHFSRYCASAVCSNLAGTPSSSLALQHAS